MRDEYLSSGGFGRGGFGASAPSAPSSAITFVGSLTANNPGFAPQITLNLPGTAVDGDLLLVCVAYHGGILGTNYVASPGPGWIELQGSTMDSGLPAGMGVGSSVFYKIRAGDVACVFTLLGPAGAYPMAGIIGVYRNCDPLAPIGAYASISDPSVALSLNAPNVFIHQAQQELGVTFFANDIGNTGVGPISVAGLFGASLRNVAGFLVVPTDHNLALADSAAPLLTPGMYAGSTTWTIAHALNKVAWSICLRPSPSFLSPISCHRFIDCQSFVPLMAHTPMFGQRTFVFGGNVHTVNILQFSEGDSATALFATPPDLDLESGQGLENPGIGVRFYWTAHRTILNRVLQTEVSVPTVGESGLFTTAAFAYPIIFRVLVNDVLIITTEKWLELTPTGAIRPGITAGDLVFVKLSRLADSCGETIDLLGAAVRCSVVGRFQQWR